MEKDGIFDVQVKDYIYKVRFASYNGIQEKDFAEDGEIKMLGHCDYIRQLIRIYGGLSDEKIEYVVRHELTHAYLDTYMSSFKIKDTYDEEDVCCVIATFGKEITTKAEDVTKQLIEWRNRKYGNFIRNN